MLSLRQLSEQIDALNERRLSLADFEDWFVSESWGCYGLANDYLSKAIAAVHHVLYGYEREEFDEQTAIHDLTNAVRPLRAQCRRP